MTGDKAPVRRRRLGAHGMMFRRRRIFAQLREGFTYEEIAAEEGVSASRIRQIVSQELQQRAVDSGAEHAKLQLDRWLQRSSSRLRALPPAIFPRSRLVSRRSTGSTVTRPSPALSRSMTTKRVRNSCTRSIAWPPISASTRTSQRRCRSA
jgi:hypothetical protein